MTMSYTTGSTDAHGGPADGGGDGGGRGGVIRAALAALGSLLVAGAWLLPLWRATLHAPQYPDGLTMWVYGDRVTGDLNEINALNHYVGLGVFDPADVPEMRLWPVAVGAALIAVIVAALLRRRLAGRLALVYLWGLPVGVLAAIQYRLHEFGHDITPGAAFRLDPFTPWVVGRTTVWNFETTAWPGWGLIAIVIAAAVLTVAPRWLERWTPGGSGRGVAVALLALALVLGGPAAGLSPAVAQADHHGHGEHDHGEHDHGAHEHPGAGDGAPAEVPAPQIGPGSHPAMPSIMEHPAAGDLDALLRDVEPGGTLRLPPGTYRGPVTIDEPVILEGDGLPIIQGDGTGSVITVTAPGTEIRGLVVRGSGPGPVGNPAGILVRADDVTVEGVVVEETYMGIAVDSAASVRIVDNHIHGRVGAAIVDEGHATTHEMDEGEEGGHAEHGDHAEHGGHAEHGDHEHGAHAGDHSHDDHDHAEHEDHGHGAHGHHGGAGPSDRPGAAGGRGDGVWLHDVDHVLVRGNHINGVRDGMYLSFGSGAVLDSNHVHGSRYAVHSMFARELAIVQNHFAGNLSAVVLMYGNDALLLRNHFEDNDSASTGFGVILKDIAEVEAVQNLIVNNRIAIQIDGPTDSNTQSSFVANTVANHEVGVALHSSAKVAFSGNSFANNTVQVLPLGRGLGDVAWSANGWGNFWSSYRGYDARGEGRGAVPHVEGGSVDRLLARNPELVAIAQSPAMQLLRSVEERWGGRDPAAVDELPLTQPVSPALPVPTPEPAARNLGIALGLVLLSPALVIFLRPLRRSLFLTRRSVRAAHA